MFEFLKKCWSQMSLELTIATLCTSVYMIQQIRQDFIYQSVCNGLEVSTGSNDSISNEICNNIKHNETLKEKIEGDSAYYISICNIIESVTPAILSIMIGPIIDVHGR